MDLILFSGNSFAHKKWIRDVEEVLKPLFNKTYIQYYRHWETGEPVILLDHELLEVSKVIDQYENYLVFGKSAGALLGLKGIFKGILKPKKCVFVGLPVEWGKYCGFEVDKWVKKYTISTLFIQKSLDPVFFYQDMCTYLKVQEVENHKTIELEGNDHYYGDLSLFKSLITEFIG